ncbi:conserved hypothetical protein [Flavobacterium sp. 9AF]|uniref:DUF4292 domain-containing protein n=1 Tax=Flavobacterium sp. 9AF TaxID=2653142 RepID=UPI0012F19F47|nr:DUF4292 domain-containing protein [Flavobacterium sp. 9AF]VXB31612.1 conserved hypothetical protein [Flavobacterium sp. 9AF]
MKFFLSLLLLSLFFSSCKSKKAINDGEIANKDYSTMKIIQSHYINKIDFNTIAIKANAKYKDQSQSHSVSADIRIKKDEIIWINVKMLGFPLAKVLITPNKVSYYEKINNTFFEGDFSMLSNWLGTDLDFFKVQNLLLGYPVDDLTKEKYQSQIEENFYKLVNKDKNDNLTKEFYFEASNFLLEKEKISQPSEKRELEIFYPLYQKHQTSFLPEEINIKARQKEETIISLIYKNIAFNEDLNFSFSIPEGYEMVTID